MEVPESLLLWLRVCVSLLCAIINGIDLSFNVYAVELKETFNFTQTQVEVTASAGFIGFGFTFLETLMTSFFGYNFTFVVAWMALPLSSVLYALAAMYNDFFHTWPSLVYLIQLLLCTSSGIAALAVERVGVEMLPQRHSGKYIGIYGAFMCMGKIVFAGLFEMFFRGKLSGFFGCLAVMSFVMFGLCYLLLYPVLLKLQNGIVEDSPDILQDTSLKDMLRSRFFHMMFWPSSVFTGAAYTVLNNITSVADSVGIRDSFQIVSLFSIFILTTRVAFGLIYDCLSSQVWAFAILFATYFSFGVGVLLAFCHMNVTTVYILAILGGIGLGPAFTVHVTMLVTQYGRSRFSFIVVIFCAMVAASQMIIQIPMGILYEDEIQKQGFYGHFCEGDGCFYWSFVGMFTLTLVVITLQLVNLCMTALEKNKEPEEKPLL